jgi:hypothetical protein
MGVEGVWNWKRPDNKHSLTEVAGWNFYRAEDGSKSSFLGYQERTGFETPFTIPGFHEKVFAEAIGRDGKTMGKSSIQTTTPLGHLSGQQHDMLESWIKGSSTFQAGTTSWAAGLPNHSSRLPSSRGIRKSNAGNQSKGIPTFRHNSHRSTYTQP